MADQQTVNVTLVKSLSGRLAAHKACASGLGLRRIHQTVAVTKTPENMGMVRKISYLLKIEEA
ncbi:50S ribosomal protein L30 [bacterium]|nr:50S ribosomal protein L30 [bacterium]